MGLIVHNAPCWTASNDCDGLTEVRNHVLLCIEIRTLWCLEVVTKMWACKFLILSMIGWLSSFEQ